MMMMMQRLFSSGKSKAAKENVATLIDATSAAQRVSIATVQWSQFNATDSMALRHSPIILVLMAYLLRESEEPDKLISNLFHHLNQCKQTVPDEEAHLFDGMLTALLVKRKSVNYRKVDTLSVDAARSLKYKNLVMAATEWFVEVLKHPDIMAQFIQQSPNFINSKLSDPARFALLHVDQVATLNMLTARQFSSWADRLSPIASSQLAKRFTLSLLLLYRSGQPVTELADYFDATMPGMTSDLIEANFSFLQANLSSFAKAVNVKVIPYWFANLDKKLHPTQRLLAFVLQHFRQIVMESGILIPELGLDTSPVNKQAKACIQSMLANQADMPKWTSFLCAHAYLMKPFYEGRIIEFSDLVDRLDTQQRTNLWLQHSQYFPVGGQIILMSRVIAAGEQHALLTDPRIQKALKPYQLQDEIMRALKQPPRNDAARAQLETNLIRILSDPALMTFCHFQDDQWSDALVSFIRGSRHRERWDTAVANTPHLLRLLRHHKSFAVIMRTQCPKVNAVLALENVKQPYVDAKLSQQQCALLVSHPTFRERVRIEAEQTQVAEILCTKSLYFVKFLNPKLSWRAIADKYPQQCRAAFGEKMMGADLCLEIINDAVNRSDMLNLFQLLKQFPTITTYLINSYCRVDANLQKLASAIAKCLLSMKQVGVADFFHQVYTLQRERNLNLISELQPPHFCRLLAARALNNHNNDIIAGHHDAIAAVLASCPDNFSAALDCIEDRTGGRQILYDLFRRLTADQRMQLQKKNHAWDALDTFDYDASCSSSFSSRSPSPTGSVRDNIGATLNGSSASIAIGAAEAKDFGSFSNSVEPTNRLY